MKHAVRYSGIYVYTYIHVCIYSHTHTYTLSRGYRARHNGIPRYINFGAHFSHRPSISSFARAASFSPFSRLLSLLKCVHPLSLALDVLFHSPFSIVPSLPPPPPSPRLGIAKRFLKRSPRKRNSIDKTTGAPSLLRMILARGTKCAAVIKSDLPSPFSAFAYFSLSLSSR